MGCAQLTRLIPAAFIPAPRSCEITAVTGLRASVSSRSPRPPLVGGCSSWGPFCSSFPEVAAAGKSPRQVGGAAPAAPGAPGLGTGSAPAPAVGMGWDEDEDGDGDEDEDEDGDGAAAGARAHSRYRQPPPRSPAPAAPPGRAVPAPAKTKFGGDFTGIPQLGETRAREVLCLPSGCVQLAAELPVWIVNPAGFCCGVTASCRLWHCPARCIHLRGVH